MFESSRGSSFSLFNFALLTIQRVRWGVKWILAFGMQADNKQCDCFVIKHQRALQSEPNEFIGSSIYVRSETTKGKRVLCENSGGQIDADNLAWREST